MTILQTHTLIIVHHASHLMASDSPLLLDFYLKLRETELESFMVDLL